MSHYSISDLRFNLSYLITIKPLRGQDYHLHAPVTANRDLRMELRDDASDQISSQVSNAVNLKVFFPQQQFIFPEFELATNQNSPNIHVERCDHIGSDFWLCRESLPGSPSGTSLGNMRPIDPSSSGPPSDGSLC